MIEKCNKVYSIFNEDIIVTDDIKLNAIQGYDVVDISNVGGTEDIIQWFRLNNKMTKNIPSYHLYRFINSIEDSQWYIGKHLIAYKGNSQYYDYPRIKAFFYNSTVILDNFNTLVKFEYLLNGITNVKKVYKIGDLSTPHKAITNYSNTSLKRIKLPYVV